MVDQGKERNKKYRLWKQEKKRKSNKKSEMAQQSGIDPL